MLIAPLQQLAALEERLQKAGLSLDPYLHLRIADENFRYDITPADAIPFASTGGDGIHFCFLTDFGAVTDLEQAPIICVTPTNDPPIRLVARNLRDFWRLVFTLKCAERLEQPSEWEEDADSDFVEKRAQVLAEFQAVFSPKPVGDVYAYLRELRDERAARVVLPTLDGLGVIGVEAGVRFPVEEYDHVTVPLEEMQAFWATAPDAGKHALLRDAPYWWVIDAEELQMSMEKPTT